MMRLNETKQNNAENKKRNEYLKKNCNYERPNNTHFVCKNVLLTRRRSSCVLTWRDWSTWCGRMEDVWSIVFNYGYMRALIRNTYFSAFLLEVNWDLTVHHCAIGQPFSTQYTCSWFNIFRFVFCLFCSFASPPSINDNCPPTIVVW